MENTQMFSQDEINKYTIYVSTKYIDTSFYSTFTESDTLRSGDKNGTDILWMLGTHNPCLPSVTVQIYRHDNRATH